MTRRFRALLRPRRARWFAPPPNATQIVSPVGIASAEAFGTTFINDGSLRPSGIASSEAWGTATIVPGPTSVGPVGIISGESFGIASFSITFDLTKVIRKARRSTGYELLAVARVPQPSGPPTFITVDAIKWKGLSWADELSKPQILNASCNVNSLTDSVVERLRKLHELPTELWLMRDGRIVFAGPWTGWNVQQDTLTFHADGLLGYTKYMTVTSDQVFAQIDQFVIAATLIDQWQNQTYGNFGIDTSQVGGSGVLRDATYKKIELHNVGQRIGELGARENGFDIEVDPATRALRLWYPKQGTDRSSGEAAIVFDALSVTSKAVSCSAAPGDVASDAYGTGTGTADARFSSYSDPELLAKFGRTSVTKTFDGVSNQSTLDDHVKALQLTRSSALLIPGPGIRTVTEVDLASYGVGDTVAYQLHERLGIDGSFRLRKRTVTVTKETGEKSALEFV